MGGGRRRGREEREEGEREEGGEGRGRDGRIVNSSEWMGVERGSKEGDEVYSVCKVELNEWGWG